ncbi:MAG: Gx transporter family protein [bacterium]|nr:Gx transporter family protein [bacterium]
MKLEPNQITRMALLTSLAVILHTIEVLIFPPILGFRLGLANIVTILALVLFGLRGGIIVTIMRCILGGLVSGTLLGPAFLLSISGGVGSTGIMGLSFKWFFPWLSWMMISVIGAIVHILIQIGVVYLVLINHIGVFIQLPFLLILATITGLFNGWIATQLINGLAEEGIAGFKAISH